MIFSEKIPNITNITGNIFSKKQLTGGCINTVYLLETEKGKFVCKWNPKSNNKNMFLIEKKSLEYLGKFNLNVPKIFYADEKCILIEYYPTKQASSVEAGRNLALLHKNSEGSQNQFGLHYNNYIGSLEQINILEENWGEFFWKYRIFTLLKIIQKQNKIDIKIWENLKEKIPYLIQHAVKPVLVHGDLWSENLVYSKKPIFIDPAIYFADSFIDIAYSKLFGGFDQSFYDAYLEIHPDTREIFELEKLYQIYFLLVHTILFGSNYYKWALSNLKYYI